MAIFFCPFINTRFMATKNFVALDKDFKVPFYKKMVKDQTLKFADYANCATWATGDSQIYTVKLEMNWMVLGPIIGAAAILLLMIIIGFMRMRSSA